MQVKRLCAGLRGSYRRVETGLPQISDRVVRISRGAAANIVLSSKLLVQMQERLRVQMHEPICNNWRY